MGIENTAEPLVLFGGTFDPVHYGHLRCAEEVRQKLGVTTVSLLPAGQPTHRATPRATAAQRLEMLQLAVNEFPHLSIDTREIERDGPSYMVDTLKDIRRQWPQRPVLLLIGQDAVNHLDSWHQWLELFQLSHIGILTRPSSHADYSQELGEMIEKCRISDASELFSTAAGRVLSLKVAAIDISATMIKSIIRLGRSPKGMLPAAVLAFINENSLYLPPSDTDSKIKAKVD